MPPPSRTVGAAPGLAEPLTGRELEVLRRLAAGKANQRIAHDLVVALDTAKKHGASSAPPTGPRPSPRARKLGLLP